VNTSQLNYNPYIKHNTQIQFKLDVKIGVNATMVASIASSYDSINRLNKISPTKTSKLLVRKNGMNRMRRMDTRRWRAWRGRINRIYNQINRKRMELFKPQIRRCYCSCTLLLCRKSKSNKKSDRGGVHNKLNLDESRSWVLMTGGGGQVAAGRRSGRRAWWRRSGRSQ
jgi:hypothetical protein